MAQATIRVPQRLGLSDLFSQLREIDYYCSHEKLVFDFSNNTFFTPYSMLLLASKIMQFRKRCPSVNVSFLGCSDTSYLGHMGFYHLFDHDVGREVGAAWGSENYLPITRLQRSDLYEKDFDQYEEVPDLIQRYTDGISVVFCRDTEMKSDLFHTITYCLREIFRNVFEHGQIDELYYCAQYWPKSNKVECSIIDFGVGIRRGLSENPNFRYGSDKEAIEYALLPSVSGKTHLPRRSEVWFNSGYGLYMTQKICRAGGSFTITSGNAAVHLSNKNKTNYQTSFFGTAVRLNINVDSISGIEKRLQQFREDAKAIADTIKGSVNRPPSAMSMLLRRDYR